MSYNYNIKTLNYNIKTLNYNIKTLNYNIIYNLKCLTNSSMM